MITPEYIMQQLRAWASTKQGKAAIKAKYGIEYDEKGNKALEKYAQLMKEILYKHTHEVIKSITMDDIEVGVLTKSRDGSLSIKISFKEGSLHRESLRPDLYPNGLDNIVLLFAHGYNARNPVMGQWKNSRSYPHTVRSVQKREPNNFLQEAVEEFNIKGGGIAKAVLEDIYK